MGPRQLEARLKTNSTALPEPSGVSQTVVPLSLLESGDTAFVFAVAGGPEHTRRLHELGFRQGVEIRIVRRGNPCILQLEDSRLCFRDGDLASVLVRVG